MYYITSFLKREEGFDKMYRRKDGRWCEKRVMPDGTTKYYYAKTRNELKRKLIEPFVFKPKIKTFEAVADEWWEKHEAEIAYNTAKPQKPAYERAVGRFGERDIAEIAPHEVAAYLDGFALTYADKTVKTQLSVINMIFRFGVAKGYCTINPCRDLSAPKGTGKAKRVSPPKDDIKIVKATAKTEIIGFFYAMAMYTGLRRGELLALEWSDIDFDARRITVSKSLHYPNGKPTVKKPKTETSVGTVPILDALLPILQAHNGRGTVFRGKGKYLTEPEYNALVEAYRASYNVHSTAHQFRHAYATMLYEAGLPAEQTQVLLRHAQLATTMDIYRDIRADKIKDIQASVLSIDIV